MAVESPPELPHNSMAQRFSQFYSRTSDVFSQINAAYKLFASIIAAFIAVYTYNDIILGYPIRLVILPYLKPALDEEFNAIKNEQKKATDKTNILEQELKKQINNINVASEYEVILKDRIDDLEKSHREAREHMINKIEHKLIEEVDAVYMFNFKFDGANLLASREKNEEIKFFAGPDNDVLISINFVNGFKQPLSLRINNNIFPQEVTQDSEKLRISTDYLQNTKSNLQLPSNVHTFAIELAKSARLLNEDTLDINGLIIVKRALKSGEIIAGGAR